MSKLVKSRWLKVFAALVVLYAGILLSPGLLGGSVVDKSGDPFAGQMTSVGGTAMIARAVQTLLWIEQVSGLDFQNRVCEIGPGRGILAQVARNTGYWYCAIDMDATALERVRDFAHVTYCTRVPPMPTGMPLVDAIVLENVIEHMASYAEAVALIGACRDKLTTGGCIVVRAPDVRYLKWGFWTTADHQWVTCLPRLTVLMREQGFEIERQGYALDHMTGMRARVANLLLRCWPWQAVHDVLYEPWESSPWSRLASKTLHAYVVGRKGAS